MEQKQDQFSVVQQVQALADGYVRARDEKAKLEEKIFQLSQDNARLEKNIKALLDKYEPKK